MVEVITAGGFRRALRRSLRGLGDNTQAQQQVREDARLAGKALYQDVVAEWRRSTTHPTTIGYLREFLTTMGLAIEFFEVYAIAIGRGNWWDVFLQNWKDVYLPIVDRYRTSKPETSLGGAEDSTLWNEAALLAENMDLLAWVGPPAKGSDGSPAWSAFVDWVTATADATATTILNIPKDVYKGVTDSTLFNVLLYGGLALGAFFLYKYMDQRVVSRPMGFLDAPEDELCLRVAERSDAVENEILSKRSLDGRALMMVQGAREKAVSGDCEGARNLLSAARTKIIESKRLW